MTGHWCRSYTIGPDRVPMPCFRMDEWALWLSQNQLACRVADDYTDSWRASTVFLGLDHNYSTSGDPVLFETMVFFADGDYGVAGRYCTWAEAAAGHERIRSMLTRESADAEALSLAVLRTMLNASPKTKTGAVEMSLPDE